MHAQHIYYYTEVLAIISFAELLFAVNPVHCEAVTGVVERADVLVCVMSVYCDIQ